MSERCSPVSSLRAPCPGRRPCSASASQFAPSRCFPFSSASPNKTIRRKPGFLRISPSPRTTESMGFEGMKVLSLESRRAKEMETLIRREGGDPFIAPSVQERALEDQKESLEFIRRLAAGEFDLVVCMTGAGLAFLRDLAAANSLINQLSQGLRSVFIVSRGPKPVPVLRELGAK